MHHLKNFKGFRDASIDLSKPVTLLIGKNGLGKSNLIEGVELLAQLVHGRTLHDIGLPGSNSGFQIRGGLQRCVSFGADEFSLGLTAHHDDKEFQYSINIDTTERISRESLLYDEYKYFISTISTNDRNVVDVHGDKKNKLNGKNYSHISTVSIYDKLGIDCGRLAGFDKLRGLLLEHIKSPDKTITIDPAPAVMRGFQRITSQHLSRNGDTLSAVLFNLDKETKQFVLDNIKQLPEEPFSEIDFITTTPLSHVMLGLRQHPGGPLVDAELLSDGTLRCLAVLTAMVTAPMGARVIIEEFDTGLHPSRIGMLLNAIWSKAEERKLNVLLTTHNPAAMNALSLDQLDGVVLCVADPLGGSRLVTFPEIPESLSLIHRGSLGDLITHEIVEKHLVPGYEEEKHQAIAAWLETL